MKLRIAAVGLAALMFSGLGVAHAQPFGFNPDTNGDGMITLTELKAFRVARMMDMDANHDGKISRAEYDAAMKERMARFAAGGGPGGPGGPRPPGAPGRGGPGGPRRDMFKETDLNGDGFVTKAEIEQAAATRFAELDANHRGYITRDQMFAGRRGPGG
jgi:Ca2+-binding EF-hand superfamily protein